VLRREDALIYNSGAHKTQWVAVGWNGLKLKKLADTKILHCFAPLFVAYPYTVYNTVSRTFQVQIISPVDEKSKISS
jgi:hypothetical protein